jgi:PmbA protein
MAGMAVPHEALLDAALAALEKHGATGDAYLEHRRTLRLQVREAKLEALHRAEVVGIGIRALKDGRLGFVHASAASPEAVAGAARNAVELAAAATPREDLTLATRAEAHAASGGAADRDEGTPFELFDPAIETQPLAAKEERARSAEAAALAHDPRIRRSNGAWYEETLRAVWFANTLGVRRHAQKSHLSVGVEPVAEDKDGGMQTGAVDHEATHYADLPDPAALGRRGGARAVELLGGRPVATGRYPVVFTPETGWTLLVYLATALNGDHLSRGRSWLAGRESATLGNELVTVYDDGRRRRGIGSLPFDGEGMDTARTPLIERGQVRGRLLDLASGKRLGQPSNGHAKRNGYEALPEIQSHDLWLEPGTTAKDAILGQIERGLLVVDLSGWWIGLNPSNPSYSSAASGLWIEKGKPVRPVSQVTVAGTIEEIFGGIAAVANDLVWDHSTKTPTFLVRELAVSGS